MRRSFLCALLLVGCAADVNPVRLVFPPDGPLGLACVDSTTREPLIASARRVEGRVETSVVLDYLGFDGVPSCRPVQLLQWCGTRGCPIRRRDCVPLVLEPPLPMTPETLLSESLAQLRAVSPVTDDAPDGVVLIRMVVTNQPCDELEGPGPLRCDDLLGCVYSCPVQLDEVQGDVLLELDALSSTCDETVVQTCAGIGVPSGRCE
ncbi:MAG: hypothetical protein H6719_35655 [Sandaracinaceae bacterium]|nr:hypothetical protein [Sandaracinaceae bacterium]